jgi:excisionase family DNA binding protein
MKPTRLQFGVRENTASSRQHASRRAVNTICIGKETCQTRRPEVHVIASTTGFEDSLHAASPEAATVEGRTEGNRLLTVNEVAELLHVPVSWVYGRMRRRCTERLPGFRLGKYWRFSKLEVLAWVASQRGGHHAA